GGGVDHIDLDFSGAEGELALSLPASALTAEDFFHREWVRSVFTLAVETLRQRYNTTGRSVYFTLFELYDLSDEAEPKVSYATLAVEFDLKTSDVTNYLAAARREFRKVLLEKVRELTATEDEFRAEARSLLGVNIK
ncbi:MAG: hypothetical protein ABJB97_09670, partial [Acidobacteriota bacterium]